MLLTGKAKEDYKEYLKNRFGFENEYDVLIKIKHEFLSTFFDLEEFKQYSIGKKREEEIAERMKIEIRQMIEIYNNNPDEIERLKSEL